jgi:predicted nucleic acid-binding protein
LIVVDASAVIDLLLPASDTEALAQRLMTDPSWHAPHLLDLEVAQVMRRWVLGNRIEEQAGRGALERLADLPITRYPHDVFLPRIWQLRHHVTAYDAAYIALAEGLDAPLVTRDNRLSAAASYGVRVEVL